MSLPDVMVLLLTYERTEYALRTIHSHLANLRYDGIIQWAVVDDGSRPEHYETCRAALADYLSFSASRRAGYGANANEAWDAAYYHKHCPITYWLEDDWVLRRPLDITPYVRLLLEKEDVGMVRLGYLPVGLDLESVGYDGRMYLNVKKTKQYAFSGNPHLKHYRFRSYGDYPVGKNPGVTEIEYDHKIRVQVGPAIWWPLVVGDDPFFAHIGVEQSYEPNR